MRRSKKGNHNGVVGFRAVSWWALALGSAALMSGIQSASAQQLEEIVVTAERRETSLQDTPISVYVMDELQIEQQVVRDLWDLSEAVPNLNINSNRGSGAVEPAFNIRGIGNGGVGLYIDDIYFPATNRSSLRTTDLESIEVLRGPQGTLFGRNSTGGAIRVFTRKPTDTMGGEVTLRLGDYSQADFEGMLNVPLSDSVFIKGEFARLTRDGYVERFGVEGDQKDLGDVDDTLGSLALRWLVNEDVTFDTKIRYEESDRNPVVRGMDELLVSQGRLIFHYGELNRQLVATGNPPLVDGDPRLIRDAYTTSGYCMLFDNDPTSFEDDCATGLKSENLQVTANLAWDINENNSFKFSAGYQDVHVDQRTDWLTVGLEIRTEDYDVQATMLEATLNSELFDDNLSLVTGINYYDEDTTQFEYVLRNNSSNQMADTRDIYGDDFTREAIGIFGQGVWHFNDGNTNLTAGLRYTSEDISATLREWESGDFNIPSCDTASSTGGGGIVVRDPNCVIEVSGNESYSEVDWKIGLDHRFNDSIMIFGTASKAYRSGTFSHTISPTIDPNGFDLSPTNPEEVVNLEVGFRSNWADNRFRLNFTYFDMDFTNRNGPRLEIMGDTARVITVNFPDLVFKGWELDANFAATENLTLFVAAGHTDAQYKTPVPPNEVVVAGVPAYGYNVGGRYVAELGGGELSFNLNYTWQDERDSTGRDPTREDSHIQASYGLLNGNIAYAFGDERNWTVSLSAQNITDEEYGLGELRFGRIFMVSPRGTPINYNQMADRGPPRMIFGSVNYAF